MKLRLKTHWKLLKNIGSPLHQFLDFLPDSIENEILLCFYVGSFKAKWGGARAPDNNNANWDTG